MRRLVMPLLLIAELAFFVVQDSSGVRFNSTWRFLTTFGAFAVTVRPAPC